MNQAAPRLPRQLMQHVVLALVLCLAPNLSGCSVVSEDCTDPSCDDLLLAALLSYFKQSDLFVAVGQNGVLRTSVDGVVWSSQNLAAATLEGVGFDSQYFYASGISDTAYRSADGASWTQLASLNTGTSDSYNSIVSYNGILVAGGGAGELRRSADNGQTWTNLSTVPTGASVDDLEVGGGQLRGVNANNMYMLFNNDATSYTELLPTGATFLRAMAYYSGVWVVAGSAGYVARTSDDGASWTNQILNAAFGFEGAAYGNGRFVVAGHDGTNTGVWTSLDGGFTWTQSSPPLGRTRGVAFANGRFVLAGNGGLLAYSATPEIGSSWVNVSQGADHSFNISGRSQVDVEGALGDIY